MKHIFKLAALSLALSTLVGCGNSNDPNGDDLHREGKKLVRLYIGGDFIEQSEEPLTRADATTYIGINVSQKKKNDPNASYTWCAYGVFTDQSQMQLMMYSDYTYNFYATTLRASKDYLGKFTDSHGSNPCFDRPFVYQQEAGNSEARFYESNINKFILSSTQYLTSLSDGTAQVSTKADGSGSQLYLYPRVHRYYGELHDYTLSNTSDQVVIDAKRMNFGIRVVAVGLPEGTQLTWKHLPNSTGNDGGFNKFEMQMPDAVIKASDSSQQWEEVYSLNELRSETANEMTIQFSWDRGSGTKETYIAKFIPRRNVMKVFNVNIDAMAMGQKMCNIIVREETEPMILDTTNIDWSNK